MKTNKSMKIVGVLVLALLCICRFAYSDLKEKGDRYCRKGAEFLEKTEDLSAGPQRDEYFQKAAVLFTRALELYRDHLKENPGDKGTLEPKMTEITSQIFWCNKLTTATFNKSSLPTAEEIMGESSGTEEEPEESGEEEPPPPRLEETVQEEKKPVTAEEKKRIANQQRIREFLSTISYLVKCRRIIEAGFECRDMLKDPSSGIPKDLIRQVMSELQYINRFLSSVFDTALGLKGEKVRYAKTITNMRVNGTINRFDKGILYIDVQGPDKETSIEMGIPLFSMEDTFLIRHINKRTKDVRAGMACLYLFEGKYKYARNIFNKISSMDGEPEDVAPFIARIDRMQKKSTVQEKKQEKEDLKAYLKKQLDYAIGYSESGNFDAGLNNVGNILSKSKEKLEYLLPISKYCHEKTGKYLPEFVQSLRLGCSKCNGTREIDCPRCHGKGVIRKRLGGVMTCPLCKGMCKIKCPVCKERLKNPRYKKYVETLKKIFKRDDEEQEDTETAEGEGEEKHTEKFEENAEAEEEPQPLEEQ